MGQTLFEKIWDEHVVADLGGGANLLYVDRHYLHELCISRGFPTLHERGLAVRNPDLTFAAPDHVISSAPGRTGGAFAWSIKVMDTMRIETAKAGIRLFDINEDGQGILHVIGPELGLTLPGTTVVCGDSHTCTNGALGALAFGIGISEVVHILATQTIVQRKPKTMRATFEGVLPRGVYSKDLILALIGKIGAAGGTGYAVEYAGSAVRALELEARMTLCNLSIELGAEDRHGGARTKRPTPMSRDAAFLPRARSSRPPSHTGSLSRRTPTQSSMRRYRSRFPACRRRSPGAPAPKT